MKFKWGEKVRITNSDALDCNVPLIGVIGIVIRLDENDPAAPFEVATESYGTWWFHDDELEAYHE